MSGALCILQQFSNECRNWMPDYFCQVTVCEIGCQSCAFFSASQRSKTETDFLFTRIFPRFPSFTFVCFEIWLVHWLICVMWLARWNYYVFGLCEVGFTPIRRLFLWFARYFCVYIQNDVGTCGFQDLVVMNCDLSRNKLQQRLINRLVRGKFTSLYRSHVSDSLSIRNVIKN